MNYRFFNDFLEGNQKTNAAKMDREPYKNLCKSLLPNNLNHTTLRVPFVQVNSIIIILFPLSVNVH